MSDFGVSLNSAAEVLATGEGNVKNRLWLAIQNSLILANFPEDPNIPEYFREEHTRILDELSKKSLVEGEKVDPIRATLLPMHYKTAAKYARRIWNLYEEFKEYEHSGFIPEDG